MKLKYLWFICTGLLLTSCLESPEYPDTPKIEFMNISYTEIGGFLEPDSLKLKIRFEDGDGDLGFRQGNEEDRNAPFNEVALYSFNPQTHKVTPFTLDTLVSSEIDLIDNIITFSDRRTVAELDTLPGYTFPEYCDHYRMQTISTGGTVLVSDTLYVQKNPRYNNIYVRFYIESGEGSDNFEEFFWEYFQGECNISYNGRFPLINDVGKKKSSEGVITYRMTSIGWNNVFQNHRVKLKIYVYDRSGHKSNEIETPPFRLSDIKTN